MTPLVPPTWTTGTTEVFKTGTWRASLPKHIHAPSPCHAACPVDGEIAEWIGCARDGDLRSAFAILTRHNPFPAIAGRICHHPCEAACNRAGYDASVSIRRLERFVGDHALAEGWAFDTPLKRQPESIAVVGGGPSGLSAAFHLRRLGYTVTLFEAQRELGGLMRDGIPAYRLPRDVLDKEIARVLALGIEVHTKAPVATTRQMSRLRADFDAVYVAIGARGKKRLPGLGYEHPWVMDGAVYLARWNAGDVPALGRRIVVIGGGSAAIDVARSARRAGHDVTVLALESGRQMPAQRDELREALEEGVRILEGAMLLEATESDGTLSLRCIRVRFEPGERRGHFTVTQVPDTGFVFEAEAIVPAIGQDPDLAPLSPWLDVDGPIVKVDARQATSARSIYAGGDVASNARFVTEAIGMGQRAAAEIDRIFRGGAIAPEEGQVVGLSGINTFYHPRVPRVPERALDPGDRVRSDAEVQLPLAAVEALTEAQRCFSCGTCIHCDNCVHYCPDLAVRREGAGYLVLTDYCKGCGLCVRECPTGSMLLVEEAR